MYISEYGDTNAYSLTGTIKFKNTAFLWGVGGADVNELHLKKNS